MLHAVIRTATHQTIKLTLISHYNTDNNKGTSVLVNPLSPQGRIQDLCHVGLVRLGLTQVEPRSELQPEAQVCNSPVALHTCPRSQRLTDSSELCSGTV